MTSSCDARHSDDVLYDVMHLVPSSRYSRGQIFQFFIYFQCQDGFQFEACEHGSDDKKLR